MIITYKELRKLEMEVFDRINELSDGDMLYIPMVTLDQFYGIEIDEFASEVAQVSLWIADHQMNIALEEEHIELRPTLPLKDAGDIRYGNALRIDWEEVCPRGRNDEVYIFGNPPYLGARIQDNKQKSDMNYVFQDYKYKSQLDYISAWLYLGSLYIKNSNSQVAFVSTNSITQGEQVYYLWTKLLQLSQISFAHTSFKWTNNAKHNAGVTVVIIGLASKDKQIFKKIFTDNRRQTVSNINPYLTIGDTVLVESSRKNLNDLPKLTFGNMPNDAGNLILNESEFQEVKKDHEELIPHIKKYAGGQDYLKKINRYCFWITDKDYPHLKNHEFLQKRFNDVKKVRLESKRKATREMAQKPYKFAEIRHKSGPAILIPATSSENREYIPMGFVNEETIVSNAALVIYNAPLWLLGLLQSEMHMTWVRAVAGRLKTDYRYSAGLCYNTFPVPSISDTEKEKLTELVLNVLDIRAEEGKSLAELYDDSKMPNRLRKAHEELDLAVEQLYRKKPFDNEQDRLSFLLDMYSAMGE